MLSMKLSSILSYLKKNNYPAEIQEETQQIFMMLKLADKEYPAFVRVYDEGHLIQLLAFIPVSLEPEVVPDMARLLHLLNKELDVPGFGMDEIAGAVFYRLMLPAFQKKIEEDLLLAYLKTIEHVCKMFATPIEAVAHKLLTLEEIIQKAKEATPPS